MISALVAAVAASRLAAYTDLKECKIWRNRDERRRKNFPQYLLHLEIKFTCTISSTQNESMQDRRLLSPLEGDDPFGSHSEMQFG